MKRSLNVARIILSTLILFNAPQAFAQSYTNSLPGVIDNANKQEHKRLQERQLTPSATDNMNSLKKKKLDDSNNITSFILKSIEISGNTVYSRDELAHILDSKIEQTVTINDLIKIANKITDYYQNNGYLTTIAYLPPQKIAKGNVKINVLEGKIGDIGLKGNKWSKDSYLYDQILKANNFDSNQIFNVQNLRSALSDLNTQEYIKGQVSIYDNEENEEFSNIVLEVEERFPLNFDIRVDNQGRELIGENRAILSLGMHNLTGYGDSLYTSTALSTRTLGIGTQYSLPISEKGTKLNLGYSYSNVNLGKEQKTSDINGFSNNYSIGLSHPFIKEYDFKLIGDLSFDLRDARTYQKNVPNLLTKYSTRVLRGDLTAIKDDFKGRWILGTGISAGIPLFGGSDYVMGREGHNIGTNKFVKGTANMTRLQILPYRSLGIFNVSGQWATRRLLASEKMQIGGIGTVRGYEEGMLIGDYGINANIEVRSPIPFLSKVLPNKLKFIDDNTKLCYFYDFGFVDDMNLAGRPTHDNFLNSIGTGLAIKLTKYMSANMYLGIPLGEKIGSNRDARFHFTITSNML